MIIRVRENSISKDDIFTLLKPYLNMCGIVDSIESIISASHKPELVFARVMITKALRRAGLTLQQIGAIINKDHASVLYYLRRYAMPRNFHQPPDIFSAELSKYFTIQYHQSQIKFHQTELKKLQNGTHEPALK